MAPRARSGSAKTKAAALPPSSAAGYRTHQISKEELVALVRKTRRKRIAVLSRVPLSRDVELQGLGDLAKYRIVLTTDPDLTASATAGSVAAEAFDAGPRARAVLRGREIASKDLKDAGGAYTLQQVQTLLHGVTRQRIDQLVKTGRLLAVPGPSNRRRYPVIQFNADGTLIAGLKEVLDTLPTKSPWAALSFLIHPDDRLQGRRPIELLQQGKIGVVVTAAAHMSEPGA